MNWATHIDLATGRPVEVPAARYSGGSSFVMWPSPVGAHSWLPMAFSPKSGLVYRSCGICHGVHAVAAGGAPDLHASAVPLDARTFAAIVRGGVLVPRGMPRYEEFTDEQLADLAFYIRTRAAKLRSAARGGDRTATAGSQGDGTADAGTH